ncbi:hypothetical protein [Edaphobacter dinghuensis]|uniref:Uncharacterized protein n=1 Tax=Edaphobacter dinghuensis TaxID=1560005 RepID=A0A917H8V3_9BACT|nr:hypothetical protein [Edaphobacter dinghuensis]GGG71725.1 hypothetical protein GCM10011585_12480 [Edaphobacter dinghuensis]
MRDPDQLIEKVLAGLRDAEAPAEMERRILDAVQSRAMASTRWNWLTTLPPWIAVKPVAYVGAVAGIAALVLTIPAFHQRHHAPTQSAKAIPSAPLPPIHSTAVAANAEPQRVTIVTRSPRRMNPRRLEAIDPEESLAMREVNAPSRPAPPLPLTEQEKLLVRFVRAHTPEELAAIDPAKWAAQDEQRRAEFDRFFRLLTKEQADKKKLAQEAMNKS